MEKIDVRLAVWLSHLAILLLVLFYLTSGLVHIYSGTNAGLTLDLPASHWLGFEYRGHPGFFLDVS